MGLKGLQGVTRNKRGIYGITGGERELQRVTEEYKE